MFTIGEKPIPAGDLLSRESAKNEEDHDHFFLWLSIDILKPVNNSSSQNREIHNREGGLDTRS